ncbi:serine/threonine-protein kinase [Streptomyces sp. NPDC057910]|uniref:serine/threonine-protein kinase n=1 Tax=Streptomyces sp. NPDC057910 TaxID=3346278 RepID=UPI0036E7668F
MECVGRGTVLGERYCLEQPLGRGSMGQVWSGLDRHLQRRVAVKTLASDRFDDPADRARLKLRFEREAKASAALDHANVATVYDADITSELCWLVMQLIDGTTLGVLLDEQERLAPDAAAAVTAQICSGLASAHAAGLVHRDLKPENVMVRRDGVVKILDFGLVKHMTEQGARLTASGESPGNFRYASPELLTGSAKLDARSDLYSVGCLLHHLLAGSEPFATEPPVVQLRSRLTGPPPSLAALGVDAPPGLQDLVAALLAPAPADRPASAREVYAALGPHLPASRCGDARTLAAYGPEDPRRPFVLPQGPPLD